MNRRAEIARLATELHKRLGTPEVDMTMQLLAVIRQDMMEALVSADLSKVPALQGGIHTLDDIETKIRRVPISADV